MYYKFTSDTSDAVRQVEYDSDKFLLRVTSKDGSPYTYGGVPYETYHAFKSAQSLGGFWNSNILGAYKRSDVTLDASKSSNPLHDFVVTYKVSGEVRVNVKAATWDEAAAKASEAFDDEGLVKEAVSIKKA